MVTGCLRMMKVTIFALGVQLFYWAMKNMGLWDYGLPKCIWWRLSVTKPWNWTKPVQILLYNCFYLRASTCRTSAGVSWQDTLPVQMSATSDTASTLRTVAIWVSRPNFSRIDQVVTLLRNETKDLTSRSKKSPPKRLNLKMKVKNFKNGNPAWRCQQQI